MPKLRKLTAAPARRTLSIRCPWLSLHADRRDLRGLQPHRIERLANEPGAFRVLDECRYGGERGRLVLGDRDRSRGIEKAAVEHTRARERIDEPADGLA